MAKVNSLFMRKANGKLAGATIYSEAGVTIMREINQSPKNPRTRAQMAHRVKLANLVNMYRALRPWLLLSTENKEALKSDYNMFVSRNLASSQVYLTKAAANAGAFVPREYKITAGSLAVNSSPTNFTTGSGGHHVYLASVASGASLTESTTFGDFSKMFVEGANVAKGWKNGMQVSIIAMVGSTVSLGVLTDARVKAFSFVLDVNSTELAKTVLGASFASFSIVSNHLDLNLNFGDGYAATSVVVIASQTVAGKTLVNNSVVVLPEGATSPFVGDAALEAAIESYGSTTDPYLTTPTPEPLG